MERINIKLDVSKINKERITERTYTNKDGEEVTIKEYAISVVPLKEPKTLKDEANYKMVKKYFVAEEHSKEEREGGMEDVFLGDGIVFEYSDDEAPF